MHTLRAKLRCLKLNFAFPLRILDHRNKQKLSPLSEFRKKFEHRKIMCKFEDDFKNIWAIFRSKATEKPVLFEFGMQKLIHFVNNCIILCIFPTQITSFSIFSVKQKCSYFFKKINRKGPLLSKLPQRMLFFQLYWITPSSAKGLLHLSSK